MTWVCPARIWSWHSEPHFLLLYSPGQSFLCWASWTQAQRATELSCPWRASRRLLAAPAHPPGAPFLPGCTEPSVRLSKGQGIFLPEPLKTQPALEGFIIMQMSWIGSAPAEDSYGNVSFHHINLSIYLTLSSPLPMSISLFSISVSPLLPCK